MDVKLKELENQKNTRISYETPTKINSQPCNILSRKPQRLSNENLIFQYTGKKTLITTTMYFNLMKLKFIRKKIL